MWRKKKSLSFFPPWEFQIPLSLGTPRLPINLPRKWLSQMEPASYVSCVGRRVLYHCCKFLSYLLKATCLSAKTQRLSHRTSDSEPMPCGTLQIIWNKELNQQINKLVNKNKFKNYYLISLKTKKIATHLISTWQNSNELKLKRIEYKIRS